MFCRDGSASGTGTEKLGGELLALELLLLAWQSTCSAALEAPVQRGAAPEFSLNSPCVPSSVQSAAGHPECRGGG